MSNVLKFQPKTELDPLARFPGYADRPLQEIIRNANAIRLYQELYNLSRTHDLGGRWFFKSHGDLGRVTDLTPYQIRKAAQHLVQLGLIFTEVRYIGNSQRSCYLLKFPPDFEGAPLKNLTLHRKKTSRCTVKKLNDISNVIDIEHTSNVEVAAIFDDCHLDVQENLPEEKQEDQGMKNKQSENVFEALGKVPAPSEKMKNSPERLYGLFVKECGMLTDAEYPELTKKTRAMVVALKKEFGDKTAEFLTQVVRGWGDASAYVGNRKGVFPPKYPGIEFIRSGSNLMWFKQWWVERNTPVSELKIKSAVVIPFPTTVPEVADEDKPMTPEQAMAALKQWKESQKAKE